MLRIACQKATGKKHSPFGELNIIHVAGKPSDTKDFVDASPVAMVREGICNLNVEFEKKIYPLKIYFIQSLKSSEFISRKIYAKSNDTFVFIAIRLNSLFLTLPLLPYESTGKFIATISTNVDDTGYGYM